MRAREALGFVATLLNPTYALRQFQAGKGKRPGPLPDRRRHE
jgi:hypothetical protein